MLLWDQFLIIWLLPICTSFFYHRADFNALYLYCMRRTRTRVSEEMWFLNFHITSAREFSKFVPTSHLKSKNTPVVFSISSLDRKQLSTIFIHPWTLRKGRVCDFAWSYWDLLALIKNPGAVLDVQRKNWVLQSNVSSLKPRK